MSDLISLSKLIDEVSNTTKTNEKINICKKYKNLKELLKLIYDPFIRFHVKLNGYEKFEETHCVNKENEHKNEHKKEIRIKSFKDLLMSLNQTLSGHDSYKAIFQFIQQHEKYRQIILRSVDKDLKIKLGPNVINRAFTNLIPIFRCPLSCQLSDQEKYFQSQKGKWKVSRKLDGVRFLIMCQDKQVTFLSRSGNTFPQHIPELKSFIDSFSDINVDGVFDGEMVIMNKVNGIEEFGRITSILSPNATENGKRSYKLTEDHAMVYNVFDFIPLDTFKNGQGGPVWKERQKLLQRYLPVGNENIRILEQYDEEEIRSLWDEVIEKGWEGLMYRQSDSAYFGKRHKSLLKQKVFEENEFVIKDATVSQQTNPKTGDLEDALEHVRIDYKNTPVWVGSGFTWEEKVRFGKYPLQLLGRTMTVMYNGETKNINGKTSLRHPRKKFIYDETRNV